VPDTTFKNRVFLQPTNMSVSDIKNLNIVMTFRTATAFHNILNYVQHCIITEIVQTYYPDLTVITHVFDTDAPKVAKSSNIQLRHRQTLTIIYCKHTGKISKLQTDIDKHLNVTDQHVLLFNMAFKTDKILLEAAKPMPIKSPCYLAQQFNRIDNMKPGSTVNKALEILQELNIFTLNHSNHILHLYKSPNAINHCSPIIILGNLEVLPLNENEYKLEPISYQNNSGYTLSVREDSIQFSPPFKKKQLRNNISSGYIPSTNSTTAWQTETMNALVKSSPTLNLTKEMNLIVKNPQNSETQLVQELRITLTSVANDLQDMRQKFSENQRSQIEFHDQINMDLQLQKEEMSEKTQNQIIELGMQLHAELKDQLATETAQAEKKADQRQEDMKKWFTEFMQQKGVASDTEDKHTTKGTRSHAR